MCTLSRNRSSQSSRRIIVPLILTSIVPSSTGEPINHNDEDQNTIHRRHVVHICGIY